MSDPLDRDMAGRSVSLIPGIIYEWTPNGTLLVDPRSEPASPEPAPTPTLPAPGVEIVQGYHLIERLGDGWTGEVWRASAPNGDLVALKLIEVGRPGKDQELLALARMAGVSHPNLSTSFGAWESGDWTVVGMNLADGTLLDRHQQAVSQGATGLDFPELIANLVQVAGGLDFLNGVKPSEAHRDPLALIHRDIKPANLLMVGGSVKVGDFGMVKPLVKEDEGVSESGFDDICSLLTAYSSPEVRQGGVSSRSDQFSLAATYCHLRGGFVPATRSEATDFLELSMLPARERPAVARAMAYNPEDRWSSCVEFVEALQASARKIARDENQASVQLIALSRMMSTRTAARDRFRRPLAVLSAVAACLAVVASYLWLNIPSVMGPESSATIENSLVVDTPTVVIPTTVLVPATQAESEVEDEPPAPSGKNSPVNLQSLVLADRATTNRSRVGDVPRDRVTDQVTGAEVGQGMILALQAVHNQLQPSIDLALSSGRTLIQSVPKMASQPAAPVRSLPDPPSQLVLAESSESIPPQAPAVVPLPETVIGSETSKNSLPKTATVIVRLPNSQAELVVKGEVGSGNPDEWYGPRRVIHSPPLAASQEYIVGAFWTDPNGLPFTRSKKFQVDPGGLYEVDLRSETPTAVEVNILPRS